MGISITETTLRETCITITCSMGGEVSPEVSTELSTELSSVRVSGISCRGSLNGGGDSDGCGSSGVSGVSVSRVSDGGILVVGNRLGNVVSQSLDLLQSGVVGGSGLNNRFLGEDRLVFNDGVRNVVDGGDGSGDNFGNGSGFVDIGGLSDGVGQS